MTTIKYRCARRSGHPPHEWSKKIRVGLRLFSQRYRCPGVRTLGKRGFR